MPPVTLAHLNLQFVRSGVFCSRPYYFEFLAMTVSLRLFLFPACGLICLGLNSCDHSQKPAAAAAPSAASQPATVPGAQVRYECPMGCAGSQSPKPGKCPVCEMELVKKS